MTRYIERCNKFTDKSTTLDYELYKDEHEVKMLHHEDYTQIISDLFEYRDVIDYNSYGCIISKCCKNIVRDVINEYNQNILTQKIKIEYNPEVIKFFEETDESNSDIRFTYERGIHLYHQYSYIPVAFLLFDKNNNIYRVNINKKLLRKMFCCYGPSNVPYKFFNIGLLTFIIDYTYDNMKEIYKIPNHLLPFISKYTPDLSCIPTYDSKRMQYFEEYMNTNLNKIKQDLNIIDEQIDYPQLKYVSNQDILKSKKEKRRAELLAELKALDNE